jgi:hypothetical protein
MLGINQGNRQRSCARPSKHIERPYAMFYEDESIIINVGAVRLKHTQPTSEHLFQRVATAMLAETLGGGWRRQGGTWKMSHFDVAYYCRAFTCIRAHAFMFITLSTSRAST